MPDWPAAFRELGYGGAAPLASGAEGTVYRLENGTVAKVWVRRPPDDVLGLQAFYADLSAARLDFATPVIERVVEVEGRTVSFERELVGTPLQERLPPDASGVEPRWADLLTRVLAGLARVPATRTMRDMPVLGERRPFWEGGRTFPEALGGLLDRRVGPSLPLWRARVEEFDEVYDGVRGQLRGLAPVPDVPLHGDLFGENVLLTAGGDLSAVLDFGFVSTAGDPRFDAAVCAAVVDMYGPHADRITDELTAHFSGALGYEAEVLRLYQAAYALATGTFFSQDGSDGHFAWAAGQLARPELRSLANL